MKQKTINILRMTAAILALFVTFIVGLADRVILVFLFWKPIHSLADERYYTKHFEGAFIRVFIVSLLITIYYLAKWLWNVFVN